MYYIFNGIDRTNVGDDYIPAMKALSEKTAGQYEYTLWYQPGSANDTTLIAVNSRASTIHNVNGPEPVKPEPAAPTGRLHVCHTCSKRYAPDKLPHDPSRRTAFDDVFCSTECYKKDAARRGRPVKPDTPDENKQPDPDATYVRRVRVADLIQTPEPMVDRMVYQATSTPGHPILETAFDVQGATTGRYQSKEPNLSAMPKESSQQGLFSVSVVSILSRMKGMKVHGGMEFPDGTKVPPPSPGCLYFVDSAGVLREVPDVS